MQLRKIGIWYNAEKPGVLDVAARVLRAFEACGVAACVPETLARELKLTDACVDEYDQCDLLVVLGGDGTLLSALDVALPLDLPMLGVNMGRVGFLSEIQMESLEDDIEKLLQGAFFMEERMLLEVEAPGHKSVYALNEVSFNRMDSMVGILTVEVEANGVLVDCCAGDGLIVATATGSTAYSLSAGGPIVSPDLDCMVLTPICPHTLNARPVVLSASTLVTVRVRGEEKRALMLMDGRNPVRLSDGGGEILVRRAEKRARFVRLRQHNYFELLRAKLSQWTRAE